MSKKLLYILLGIGALVLIAIGIFFMQSSSNDESSNSANSGASTNKATNTASKTTFNPLATTDTAFVAKMTGTTDGKNMTATIMYDGKGKSKYTGTTDGQSIEMYITKDSYITCQGGTCFKVSGSASAGINLDDYTYSEDKNKEFSNIAKRDGTGACPAGTCQVWKVVQGDTTTRVFVDSNNRVSKLTTESPDGTFVYTYTYKPVTVKLPTNVQELPTAP